MKNRVSEVKTDKWHTEILKLALTLQQTQNVEDILMKLQQELHDFFHVESVRLFAVDHIANEIYTKIAFQDVLGEIRFPISAESVAGYTALTRQMVILIDVRDPQELEKYSGLKYDDRWEKKTGLQIRSIYSMPLLRADGELQGVFQLINLDKNAPSPDEDNEFLNILGNLVAESLFHKNKALRRATRFDLLLERNTISQEELNQAIKYARDHRHEAINGDITSVLVERFGVPSELMGESLSRYFLRNFYPYDESLVFYEDLFHGINKEYLRRHFVVPIKRGDNEVTIIMDDPAKEHLVQEIKEATGMEHCRILVGLRKDILQIIDGAMARRPSTEDFAQLLEELPLEKKGEAAETEDSILDENAPTIVMAVNRIILEAYEQGVSDIHIEPMGSKKPIMIRFRRDGICSNFSEIPASYTNALINRLKIMARVKLDERRFPQSGKIKLKYGEKDIELRVEVTPTVGGLQDVVMRILASGKPMPLKALNLSESNMENLEQIINKPYGIILVVGPTGSGKTTTLHAIMGQLNTPEKKIWTAEDPVEITQRGLRQVQVNPNIKPVPFDFAKAMRSFLRADPDIIMVGEMRDKETANIAIEASLTGHLVLSTLHTNSAPETVTRLVEMGINPINLSDALLGVFAQRLVRVLCKKCKKAYQPEKEELQNLFTAYGEAFSGELSSIVNGNFSLYRRTGCTECGKAGYHGRTGIHELLVGSQSIRKMIGDQAHSEDIKLQALKEGMRTLKMDGIRKVLLGQSDFAEVMRVCIE